MLPIVALILLAVTLQAESTTTEELKTIFQIPRKNYDELEILERSSFGAEATPTTSETPKSYANAQVFVRFGGEGEKTPTCGCGQVCQCKQKPQLVPVLAPLPYCVCFPQMFAPPQAPPLKTPEAKESETVEEPKQNPTSIKSNNHPEILETVNLSNEAITNNVKKEHVYGKVAQKIEPNELSPNVKIIDLELPTAKTSSKDDLVDCLVPYEHPKLAKPKLLVTFPIFGNKDKPVETPKFQVSHSGYSLTRGSGYYDDPARTIIYRKPTVLSMMDQKLIGGGNTDQYVLVPIGPVVPTLPVEPTVDYENEDCCCCSCAKYAGELNEQNL